MTPTQYVGAFARFWWVIVLCAVAGVAVSSTIDGLSSTTYISSTSVVVSSVLTSDTTASEAYASNTLAQQRMDTYAALANGPTLINAVIKNEDLHLDAEQVKNKINVSVPTGATVLTFTIRDTDQERVRLLASTTASSMVNVINRFEAARGGKAALLQARVTSPAAASATAAPPPSWRNPLLGVGSGLIIGLVLSVVLARLDRRLRDNADVVDVLGGAPVLGDLSMRRRRMGIFGTGDSAARVRAIRELRTSIYFLHPGGDSCLAVALTSPHSIDRMPQIGIGVACALADTGAKVLVIDGDLHRSSSSTNVDMLIEDTPGLAAYLSGASTAAEVITHVGMTGVDAIPSGLPFADLADPADLLHSVALARLLEGMAERYDFVLVNTPPTSVGTDAAAVAARCDGTLMAVARGRTRRAQLRESTGQLRRVHARILGAVLVP